MRGTVFAHATVCACILYLVLQILFGVHGIYSLRDTYTYIRDMEAHIVQLDDIQKRLKDDVLALTGSEHRMRKEANRIGYYDRRDVVIRTAVDTESATTNDFGRYLQPPSTNREDMRSLFRWIATAAGLLYIILHGLLYRKSTPRQG